MDKFDLGDLEFNTTKAKANLDALYKEFERLYKSWETINDAKDRGDKLTARELDKFKALEAHMSRIVALYDQQNAAIAKGAATGAQAQVTPGLGTIAATGASKDPAKNYQHISFVMMQAAATAEDLQYGLQGVTNNIVYMASMMGPWGSAAALVFVGATSALRAFAPQVKEYTDIMAEGMNAATRSAEKLDDRIKELEKRKPQSAYEVFELGSLTKQQREAQQGGAEFHENAPTDFERKLGDKALESAKGKDWESAKEKIRIKLESVFAGQANEKAQQDLTETLEKSRNEAPGGMAGTFLGAPLQLAKKFLTQPWRSVFSEKWERDHLKGAAQAGAATESADKTGALIKRAKSGDISAIRELIKKLREVGNVKEADQIESDLALMTMVGPPQTMSNEEYVAKFNEWEARQVADKLAGGGPAPTDWQRANAERLQKQMQAARESRAKQQERHQKYQEEQSQASLSEYMAGRPDFNENALELLRQKTFMQRNGQVAARSVEGDIYKLLRKQGVSEEDAMKAAKEHGSAAYGEMMSSGYAAMKHLQEMAMTGGIGRGVQQLSTESYLQSIGTTREGIDKQQLDLMKMIRDATVFQAEWMRRNGMPAKAI